MKSRFPLIVLVVALAIITVVAWEPLRSRAGLLSASPSPTPALAASPSPSPTPGESVVDEQEPAAPASEVQSPRFDKCVDGSALTVTSTDANQTNYKCESGAEGGYLNK